MVFSKRCIQYPMAGVFDTPVLAYMLLLLARTAFEAADVVGDLSRFFGFI